MREPDETIVEGEVERLTYENPETGFRVLKVAVSGRPERLSIIGTFPSVPVGARVRVRGRLEVDPRHGEQLRAAAVTELTPTTLVGIERYLGSGMIRGLGEKYAKRIVETFGLETLKVLDETPERLREVEGLGRKRAEAIARGWREQRSVRDVMVFLQAHGASSALAMRILKRYGPSAVTIVSQDPYRLAVDVWGIGFKTADRIAAAVGIGRDSAQRTQAGTLQALLDATEAGHVYTGEPELTERAAKLLGLETITPAEEGGLRLALEALGKGEHAVIEHVRGQRVAFTAPLHAAEVRLARRLVEVSRAASEPLRGASQAIAEFEARTGVRLAPEQRHAVEQAALAPVLVITGGHGVGKTTIVRAILAMFARAGIDVRLAAPTGRAAKRMSEATGHEASTLHRLLEFDPKRRTFKRDHARPLEVGALVVDEASMVDLTMADALLQATPPGTRLVLVGDVDQLPSVGAGAVLRDVIASGEIPCARLTRIFRQAAESLIVTNAHRINAGDAPIAPAKGDTNADFFMIERRDPDAAKATILELVTRRIPQRFHLDPRRDIQVLTPMHRGPAGSIALNEALQEQLNPPRPGIASVTRGHRTFRVGDKVMQLRNDYERGISNGDVGFVARIDAEEQRLIVGFDEREVEYETSDLDELTLAYACSVHKAQGSEYPAVVVPLLTTHYVMLSRNLLYTAVTRGKRLVVLVYDPRALTLALAEDRRDERRTRLVERIVAAARGVPLEGAAPGRPTPTFVEVS